MINAVYHTAEGEILETRMFEDGTLSATITAATPPGATGWVDQPQADPEFDYVSGGTIVERPEIFDEEIVYLSADEDDLPDTVAFPLPTGTIVIPPDSDNYTSGVGEQFTVIVEIYGEWTYQFRPPFPYRPLTLYIGSFQTYADGT